MGDRTLAIWLNGLEVGLLWEGQDQVHFRFRPEYLDAAPRWVLGQYFEDRLHPKTRRASRMFPWFENALPERNGALRRRMAQACGLRPLDSVGLLAALGEDLPGAIRIKARDGVPVATPTVDEPSPSALAQARFSLGGVQLKFSMSGSPSRLALGVRDRCQSAWILKLGTSEYPRLAENEHAIMTWCRVAGFNVPETRVVPVDELPELGPIPDVPTGFLVKRYDRGPDGAIHQEDFAQVYNVDPSNKYEATHAAGLLRTVDQILGSTGAEEGLRRLVATVATGNCDAHLKNWSLIYPDGIRADWSPLYDQVATVAFPQVERRPALRIGHAHHLHEVRWEHIRWVGEFAGISPERCDAVIDDTLLRFARSFSAVEMYDQLRETLSKLWTTVPLLRTKPLG